MWRVIVLVAAALWGSAVVASGNSLKDPYVCGPPTCIPSDKFKYMKEIIYHYDYEVNINTWFAGAGNNRSVVNVKTAVSLQFITACEGLLQLSSVSLEDQDENYPLERQENFVNELSRNSLRFSFHDGLVSEICPSEGEEEWALNFKRGVLSLFQNTMKRFDIDYSGIERDVHGTCDTDYRVRGQENTSLIVLKRRDLTQCTDRYKYMSILQTVRYNFQSKFQTWPVLKSESKCRISIDHNVYAAVSCRERHLFEPFSGKLSGAVSTVEQELRLAKEINKTDTELVNETPAGWSEIGARSNLLHHHTAYLRPATGELKTARDVLKLLCKMEKSSENEGPSHVADKLDGGSVVGVWGRLVRAARGLPRPALAQLLARAAAICPRAEKHLLDALPYVASVGSVDLITEKLLQETASADTRHEWLMSMAMIPRPKKEMIGSMLQLLRKFPTDRVVSFTASSMVHSYCRNGLKSLSDCCKETYNAEIVKLLQNNVIEAVRHGAANLTRDDREKMTTSIKALGNIGGYDKEFADVLLDIIDSGDFPTGMRLTAIDAFRRTPCADTREYFLHIFREDYVDVEVRLACYLQVMRCPDLVTIRKIFHALRNEPVNQVATFVWSHLDNLGQSSLPSRVEVQGLLSGNTVPPLQDSPDFRKYSRNYERSQFFHQYNAGGNCEANVIFSPSSYIPRSLSLNLTVDMFGESINLLELKARGEGFEPYFEQVFGNDGPLSKNKVTEKLRNFRVFRSLNDADDVRGKIDSLGYEPEALKHQFPMLDLGMKVFGNEISYWNAEGDEDIRSSLRQLNPLYQFNKILSGQEISYKKASLFLDTTYSVPTGCGLPLQMQLMGTSYVELRMSGAMSPADTLTATYSLDTEGKIHPSVALNVAATMSVAAGTHSATGVRVDMRLYTATAVAARLKLRGSRLLHLDLSLPYSKQEIFGAKSELIILHGDKEIQQRGVNENQIEQNTCSWSAVDRAIGIKICAAYQFPNMTNVRNAPYFLLSGPSKYLVSLEKVDPSARNYSLRYEWHQNRTDSRITLSFDTPNSKSKRMFNATVAYQADSGAASMSFQSNEHTLKAHATYKNHHDDKLIESMLDIDGQKHFDAVASLKRHPLKNGYVYVPSMYVIVNNEKITELSGTLRMAQKRGVSQCDVSVEFQTKRLASRLIGYVTWNGPSRGARLRLDYQFLHEGPQSVKMEGVLSNRDAGPRRDLYSELGLEFSSYPHLNFFSGVKYLSTANHIETTLNVSSSRQTRYSAPKLQFGFVLHRRLSGLAVDTSLLLHRPEVTVKLKFEEAGAQYTAAALLSYDPTARDVLLSGKVYWPPGAQLYIDAGLNATLPSLHPLVLTTRVHEKSTNEFVINVGCVWFNGVDFDIDALYQDQSTSNVAAHHVKLLVTSKHYSDVSADVRFTQDNKQTALAAQGEYDEKNYGTYIRYVLHSEQNFTAYAQLEVDGNRHSLGVIADLNNDTSVDVDLHIEQVRDVHMTYRRAVSAHARRLTAELNWDANRDPSQKVSVDARLRSDGAWSHSADLELYYPGRMINGRFEFLFRDWLCKWLVRLGWSPEDALLWDVKMYSEVRARGGTVYALLSRLDTPFRGWEDSSLNLMWRYQDNLQALNGSASWQRERISFALLADYALRSDGVSGELSALVNSSVASLPSAAAVASHRHVWKRSSDTLLSFQYNNDKVLMVNSSWLLDRGDDENNITGRVTLRTPVPGYTAGLLRTKFVFGHRRDVRGVTHLHLEERTFKITVDGHMRRLTNCMLVVNVTSPQPQHSHTSCRFGFVEAERHLVAMVTSPATTTGLEILARLSTAHDFHVFAHVALPVQFLNRALLQAKRNREGVDFRLGWDKMDAGFTGIWHYHTVSDFQYLYKLFTPLEGFEENGCVLRNIYGDGLDTEFSVRLSKHKFGVSVLTVDTGRGLLDVVSDKLKHKQNMDVLLADFETDAYVTLDTLYYPTVTFHAHINKNEGPDEEEIYKMQATLNLPNKTAITLTDTFTLFNFATMDNELRLVTPFAVVRELRSLYSVAIAIGEKYNVTFHATLYNGTHWSETSVRALYSVDTGEDEEYSAHLASVHVATPLAMLPALDARLAVHVEDTLTRMSCEAAVPSYRLAAVGQLEMDEPFVESSGSLNLTSPYLDDYFISVSFKKDFSSEENVVAWGLQVQSGDENNYMSTETVWSPSSPLRVRVVARAALEPLLPPCRLSGHYTHVAEELRRTLYAECHVGEEENFYSLSAEQRNRTAKLTVKSPLKGFRTIDVAGEIDSNEVVKGTLVSETVEYSIDGRLKTREPLDVTLSLIPKGKGDKFLVRLKCELSDTKYVVSASLIGTVQVGLNAKLELNNSFTDVYFKLDAPQMKEKEVLIKSRLDVFPGNRSTFTVQAATPLARLRTLAADVDLLFGPKSGFVKCLYNMTDMSGDGDLRWSFLWDDMYLKALGQQRTPRRARSVDVNAHYGNATEPSGLLRTDGGFWVHLDRVWQIGANATYGVVPGVRVVVLANAFLPRPNLDVHSVRLELGSEERPLSALRARYTTDVSRVLAAVGGEYKMESERLAVEASAAWGAGGAVSRVRSDLAARMRGNDSLAVQYSLHTPLHADETFTFNGSYSKLAADDLLLIQGEMRQPGSRRIGELDVTYGGARRTRGRFNLTTPFRNLAWLDATFNVTNGEDTSENHVQVVWPNKTASLHARHRYVRAEGGAGRDGDVRLVVPLASRHVVSAQYRLLHAQRWSRGNATLLFDGQQFVQGSFRQVLSKSARDMDLATTDVELENQHTPVGIKYIHEYGDLGNIDVKQATVFHLRNSSSFNITGVVDVTTQADGKTIQLTAIHSERTLTFRNDYRVRERELRQGSRVQWAPDVWIQYDIRVTNTCTTDTESQQMEMSVQYPRRSFHLLADYRLQEYLLDGAASLDWDLAQGNRSTELRARWESPPLADTNLHLLALSLHHPSFRRNVTLEGSYASGAEVISNVSMDLRYSDYENEHLKLKSVLRDNSRGPSRDYEMRLLCTHPASNLDLDVRSDLIVQKGWYRYNSYYRYKKTMFNERLRETRGLVDLRRNLLQYERNNETDHYKLNSTWDLSYPQYRVHAWVNRTSGQDTAEALLSMLDKLVVAHYNSSDDISYHLIGIINDARSAQLNSWRDFDDVTTVDVSSYIRLNHSRLLTSSILWRPEIFGELRGQALYALKQAYNQVNESLTIVKEAPMEAHAALKNVYGDAKLKIRDFLEDLNDLGVIKNDLDEFHSFLNVSYHNNDFYVKNLVEFSSYVLDQMALKNHFDSLPTMLNEMWGMMGDTSASIKKSLVWVIENIKASYASFVQSFNKILEADFMDQVSDLLENGIMKYDNFIRDFHLRFVTYWETTWTNAVSRFVQSWRSLLKSMEPTFLKFVHYAETIAWTVGKEVMDFFYQRTHELTESPYFNYVSALGQDLDHFIKDLTQNDAITNVKKYSAMAYNAIYNRFLVHVPFRKELQEVAAEILEELNRLQELTIVHFVKAKFWEAKARLQWWYDYFHIGEALERVGDVLYEKVTEKLTTALDYEELHRTPKTHFVFDPHKGEVLLEQKLPMSWHAFNRTPDFSEIPEYKAVRDVVDDWLVSNRSVWSYYYDLKPYLDFNNVVPPFAGMAIMTGQGTLVTFDKQVFTVAQAGTFLLSHDYKQANFSVLMESNRQGRYDLLVPTRTRVVRVNLYRQEVSTGEAPLDLPAAVDEYVVDREQDTLTISSRHGVHIECNFLFNTCKLQLAGWYFATVGGLLGTMTNEQYDDLQLPSGARAADTRALAAGWTLRRGAGAVDARAAADLAACHMFFRNKVSPLHPCFAVIDATPFHAECTAGVEACALAGSYLEMCAQENVPVHVPEQCVRCTSPQGEVIEEGSFFNLEYIPNSTDVVFLVEAQFCNKNIRKARNLDVLVDTLDTKLRESGLTNNRYAVIGFGGSGLYETPRSLYVKNKVFVSAGEVLHHFDTLLIEKRDLTRHNGTVSADMFGALSFASSLPYRPGVTRTYFLVPCTRCDLLSMKLDYSVVQQVLTDDSVTLHILMDADFMLSKKRVAKTLYGVDSARAYSMKDARALVGDEDLRKQVKLPKDRLGFCGSLAIESNGTVFAGKKLELDRATARRVSAVLGARAAQSARPCAHAPPRCECRDSRLHCRPCVARHRSLSDMSSALWDDEDVDDLIDNIMDINLPNIR